MGSRFSVFYIKEEGIISMAYIKNGIVKMLWDADKFFEDDNYGFIAAVHEYNGRMVVFKDSDAFLLRDPEDPDNAIADLHAVKILLRESVLNGLSLRDDYSDLFIDLLGYDGCIDEDTCQYYGITDTDDIMKRISDLSPYFEVEFVEDPMDA